MWKGRRYRVSCDDLRSPRTKEESFRAANAWWEKKVAQLTLQTLERQQAEQLAEIQSKMDWAAQRQPELLPHLEETKERILANPDEPVLEDDETIHENLAVARLMGIEVPPTLDPIFLRHFFGNRRIWQERFATHKQTEANKTIGYQLERFLAEQRTRQRPRTHQEVAKFLRQTLGTEVWAKETSVESVDEQTVERFYGWLVGQHLDAGRHNKLLSFFRRFVGWLDTTGMIERAPKNLKRRDHRKRAGHKEVKTYDGVRKVVEALPMPYRLWALLGLNCGMTQADLGQTTWEQVDQESWTLTRRRAKTGENPKTPTVRYKLWAETIEALKTLTTRKGLLFLTDTGRPLWEARYREDGSVAVKDLFGSYWQGLDPKPTIPIKAFRSIAASTLKHDTHYRGFVEYYLAHTPSSVADQNYAAESDQPFYEALRFIRKELGFGAK
jgi:integrase